jgi:hypothetical protein
MGGSAWKMAQDITEGYITVNLTNLKKYTFQDLKQLSFELGKCERSLRGEQVDINDIDAVKGKNRRLQRISHALTIMRDFSFRRFKQKL